MLREQHFAWNAGRITISKVDHPGLSGMIVLQFQVEEDHPQWWQLRHTAAEEIAALA